MAIRIQREVGGNLAVLLDTVSDTMIKRERVRRELRALTAEGRLSAIVLEPRLADPRARDLAHSAVVPAAAPARFSRDRRPDRRRGHVDRRVVLAAPHRRHRGLTWSRSSSCSPSPPSRCGAWAASTTLESRSGTRRSMRAIDDYQVADVARAGDARVRSAHRVLAPVWRGLLDVDPEDHAGRVRENVKRKIVLAGNPPGYEVDRFLIFKLLGLASGAVWIVLGGDVLLQCYRLFAILFVLFALGSCASSAPTCSSTGASRRRREEIERRLPDTLDLLVISVEAGLGFEQALERTAARGARTRCPRSRAACCRRRAWAPAAPMRCGALDERTQVDELRTFILAMLQADTFGVSIARILRSQADEIRVRRRQAAQEKSQKAPIKMLFPLRAVHLPGGVRRRRAGPDSHPRAAQLTLAERPRSGRRRGVRRRPLSQSSQACCLSRRSASCSGSPSRR